MSTISGEPQDKERDREMVQAKERLDAADALAQDTNEKVKALYSQVTGSGQSPEILPYTASGPEYLNPGLAAHVPARALVDLSAMKVEVKKEDPEKKEDPGLAD